MSTTPDNTAITWRDLADALIQEQIAYLQDWEHHPSGAGRCSLAKRGYSQLTGRLYAALGNVCAAPRH